MKILFSAMLLYLNLVSSATSIEIGATDVFTEALVSLKSEFVDHYNSLEDWFTETPSQKIAITACSWSGISCNSNSTMVIGLDLSKRGLSGHISGKQFRVFVDLVNLNLSHNLFSGHLPISIFNLTNLKTLDISRNNFSGYFPNGVSGLKKLSLLDAFSNSFSGQLPTEVSQIDSLKTLNFAGSYFSGQIPSEYGNFKSLELIFLAGNLISGEIPHELGKIQTMIHMEIGYNSYQGGIPWQLGNMSKLQYLDIAGANLSGSIPKELSNLTSLESLFLFKNQLSGLFPSEFSNLVSLKSLDLSDNLVSGEIPTSFYRLKNLTLLSLMYNQMTGTVPQAIADLPKLETLLIWNNFFYGSLPHNLGVNSNLKLLDVSTNSFDGSIPPNLCANGFLSKLILFSNNFTGHLPASFSSCSSFVRIRVEDNSLSGPISLNFSVLSDISYVDLSRNNFTGGIPDNIINASKLEYLNVSNNPNLGGNLPLQVWSMPFLQNFSASSCSLSGCIPSFQSCKYVTVVELSSNTLSGNIPETISDCKGLTIVNLSSNNLSGSIPTSLQLLNVSFIGNPKLCGLPLHPCSVSKKNQAEFLWVLILCVSVVSFIGLVVCGVYYIHKARKMGQWKIVSFSGLPIFDVNDVVNAKFTDPKCKITLPTGITVVVKKIECDSQMMKVLEECIIQIGNARHKNLMRLHGYCYNNDLVYLMYDYLPNGTLSDKIVMKRDGDWDWASKYKIVMGIVKGLYFLHHECYPAIPHGDLRPGNIILDENMEPQLAEFGFRFFTQLSRGSFQSTFSKMQPDGFDAAIKEELSMDVYNFGEIVIEILTNGRVTHASQSMKRKPTEALLEDIYSENEVGLLNSSRKELSLVFEVSLLCTRSNSSDRPSMADVLKLLSASNST